MGLWSQQLTLWMPLGCAMTAGLLLMLLLRHLSPQTWRPLKRRPRWPKTSEPQLPHRPPHRLQSRQ